MSNEEVGYDINGEVIDPNCDSSLCKCGEKSFFIKFCTSGCNAGMPYNPNSLIGNKVDPGRKNVRKGQNYFQYKRVSKAAFEYYLKFLQTKGPAWYNRAVREVAS